MPSLVDRTEDSESVVFTYVDDGQSNNTVVVIYKTDPATWKVTLPSEVQPDTWQELVAQLDINLGVT